MAIGFRTALELAARFGISGVANRSRSKLPSSLRFAFRWSLVLAVPLVSCVKPIETQAATIAFVQANSAVPQTPQTSVPVIFTKAQAAGDLNVVVVGWSTPTASVSSVTDSKGNVYTLAVGPTVRTGTAAQAIYYASNIAAAPANGNTVTVTFSAPAAFPDIRIAEYSGIAPSAPVDVSAGASGSSGTSSSGSVTTTNANDLLVGANYVQSKTTKAGSGYTSRLTTNPDGDILEDKTVTTVGSQSATASVAPSGWWVMQMVAFRFAAAGPTVSSVSPNVGPVVGGTVVTITGTNFAQGATVMFGSQAATSVTFQSATQILATTPAGIPGAVPVTVTVGGQSGSLASGFTYVATPTVSAVSPSSGSISGGTAVTITGTNFAAGATVKFGTATATNVVVTNSTTITATTPAGSAGAVTVTVTVGGQSGSLSSGFTYVATPTVSAVSPSSGPTSGGTAVTITGTNFVSGATVKFGTATATNVAVTNSTTITATTPAGSAGAVTVTVTVSGQSGSLASGFTYIVTPTVSSVSPNTGPVGGGTVVTITGTNFASGATVTFGAQAATNVTVTNSTTITATTPAGSAGAVPVTVTVGGQSGSLSSGFTYVATPTVSAVSPSSGPTSGGTAVTITGTNFVSGATVTFGTQAATNVAVTNSTTITATTPAGSAGAVTVTVTNPGALAGSLANGFTYTVVTNSTISYVQSNFATPQSSPTTVSVPFTAAQTAGDLIVVVVGWDNSTSTVSKVTDSSGNSYALAIGPTVNPGTASQSIYYARDIASAAAGTNSVTVTFSAATPYPDVRVLEYKGADLNTPVDVTAGSSGSSATSSSGSATTTNASDLIFGANYISTLTTGPGSGFTQRILTTPDGDIAEDQMVTSTGSYSASAPISPSGWWVMQMVAFRAAAGGVGTSPTITSLSPNSGALGTPVTISGTNFGSSQGTSTVTFNGTPATTTSWSSTSIVATVPANATTGDVIVTVGGSASNGVSFSVTSINVSVTPRRAAVTKSQTQQFTATVTNDPQNGGVTWSVDGNNGGNATSGTVTSGGLFTPGTQVGAHVVTATSNSNTAISASANIAVTDLTGVFTYHNDPARTGQNLQEYALTTTTVNSSTFGPLFTCPVDGYVYSMPLYVANLAIGGQTRNVVFIATENDSVYAFDADSPSCLQLWKKSFLATGVTTVLSSDVSDAGQGDIDPQIGITSTPVIDPTASIIYVTAYTKEKVGTGCSTGSPCYVYRLHALDLATGTEQLGGPVAMTAPNFNVQYHLQRPALLLNNGNVYVAFGSHGDNNTWQGWLMAYNAKSLAQEWVWHSTDPTSGNNEGAIWASGNGPAVDASGNIYVETANGTFDGVSNFSDSVIKISPSGTMVDYFTPFDQGIMQQNDIDLGSSGPIILPDSLGSSSHPHLMLAAGKVGVIYLLDQTNLGKYNAAANQDVGESTVGFNTTDSEGGFYSQPAYWNGNIYGAIVGDALRQYPISNGAVAAVSSSESVNTFSFRGSAPAVSASGTTNGIVWAVDFSGQQSGTPLVLYAYDATNVSTLLYSSPSSGSGAAAAASKFTVPVVANGKVYVVGQSAFTVFGLLPQ